MVREGKKETTDTRLEGSSETTHLGRNSMTDQIIEQIVSYSMEHLPLEEARLSDEYYYQSLPPCVIDAVFSIGVRYGGVRKVVERFCNYSKTNRYRPHGSPFPERHEQMSTSQFLDKLKGFSPQELAENVFVNRQRTSSRSGILKAEATILFVSAMREAAIEHFQDVNQETLDKAWAKIVKIPGQKSGICFSYFQMLAGNESRIKPDRMLLRFLKEATGRDFSIGDATNLIVGSAKALKLQYSQMTPRLLDHLIWQYTRSSLAA